MIETAKHLGKLAIGSAIVFVAITGFTTLFVVFAGMGISGIAAANLMQNYRDTTSGGKRE